MCANGFLMAIGHIFRKSAPFIIAFMISTLPFNVEQGHFTLHLQKILAYLIYREKWRLNS